MGANKKIEWVHCNQCHHKTQHKVVATRRQVKKEEVDDAPFDFIMWETTNTMLECCGCGEVVLRRAVFADEMGWDDVDYFPPPISRQAPQWRYKLPDQIRSLVDEVYTALHANSRCLALMGARTLIDLFINVTIGDIGDFKTKLQGLVDEGHLSKRNKEHLEVALDAGHASTHRAFKPSTNDLNLVMDIVENLIQPLALKNDVEQLKQKTPQRKIIKK